VLVKFINPEYQSKNRNRLLEGVQWMNFNFKKSNKKVLVKFINQEYQSKNRNRLLEGVQWMNFNSSGKSQTNMVFGP